jgi:FlaA1/EpsC-like NDP-sugar epimerase
MRIAAGATAALGKIRGRRSRRAVRATIDASVVLFASIVACALKFPTLEAQWDVVATFAVAMVVMRGVVARAFAVHRSSWRLFSLGDAARLGLATMVVSAAVIAAREVGALQLPHGVLAMEGLLSLAGLWGVRAATRMLDETHARTRVRPATSALRALLVGAGRDGRIACEELRARPAAGYDVVGFLDDAAERQGQRIAGVPVLGTIDEVVEVARATAAQVIVLTMPGATRSDRLYAVERCQAAGLPIRTVPAYWEVIGGKVEVAKIRSVKIEDLLGREVVTADASRRDELLSAFRGKRILVTGAGGSIGSELCRQLAALEPAKLVLFEYSENNLFDIDAEIRPILGDRTETCLADIRDAARVARVFRKHRPEVVFHAAAYKHVPMMELHPPAAIDNNVRGTRILVEAAHAHGVERFVFVSTDKAVNPTNVMGASKRAAELVVQTKARSSSTKMSCVRFGNVLGSRGSVLHTFRRQIEMGGPVTVTHPEMTRFFMTIPEAVRLVLQAGAIGRGGEVFLLDMGDPVKIVDLAQQMIRLGGVDPEEVRIEFCGLRPGEKLFEELAHDGDDLMPSGVAGVNIVRPQAIDARTVMPWVATLEAAADARDVPRLHELLAIATGYHRGQAPIAVHDDDDSEELLATG